MDLSDLLFGSEGRYQQRQVLPQESINALQKILGQGVQNTTNPYQGFEPIKQAALSNFMQNIVPELTERFAASGDNAPSSGTLHQSLSQAGSSLAEKLASLQADYGQRQQQLGLQQTQLGLTPGFEEEYIPGEKGLLMQLAPLLAQVGSAYFSGGATLPAQLLSLLGNQTQEQPAAPVSQPAQGQPVRFKSGAQNAFNTLKSPLGGQKLLNQATMAGFPSTLQPSLSSILGV